MQVMFLLQWPPKGPQHPYDPLNYNPDQIQEYGGYLDEGGRGSSGSGGNRFGGREDRFGGSDRYVDGFISYFFYYLLKYLCGFQIISIFQSP